MDLIHCDGIEGFAYDIPKDQIHFVELSMDGTVMEITLKGPRFMVKPQKALEEFLLPPHAPPDESTAPNPKPPLELSDVFVMGGGQPAVDRNAVREAELSRIEREKAEGKVYDYSVPLGQAPAANPEFQIGDASGSVPPPPAGNPTTGEDTAGRKKPKKH